MVRSASARRRTAWSLSGAAGLAAAVCCSNVVPVPPAQAAPAAAAVRMTVAPAALTDASGALWAARAGFDGGEYYPTYSETADIVGTTDDRIYRPELVRMTGWHRDVPAGTYDVTLKMRESWWNTAGSRVFDVLAEGAPKLTGVDIVKAVGKDTAYDRTFRVTVTDGRLDLGFRAIKDSALVSAIELTPVAPTTPTPAPTTSTTAPTAVVTRMSVASTPVKDAAGVVYAARTGFVGGRADQGVPGTTDVARTTDDALYRPGWVGMSAWSRAVPNGAYDVTLKMRESYFSAAGRRVFDVAAEGAKVVAGLDLVKAAGRNAAHDRTFRVDVKDGRLDLRFTATKDLPVVSAIVVTKASAAPATPAPAPTPTPTPTPKPTPTPTPTPSPTPTPKPASGDVARPSGLIFDSGVYHMNRAAEVTKLEQARGRKADVISVFPSRESWGELQGTWYMDSERIPAGYRGTLNVGMPLFPQDGSLSRAASGADDAQWATFARTLAARYPNAYVRIGWEMNIGWYYRATPANAAQWKQAFRRASQAMTKAAPGLRIVWCVNEGPGQTGTPDAAAFWPGDDVVDIVAMDAYDWDPGYTSDAAVAAHRDAPYGWNHWLNFARAHGKKFALPEWGIAPTTASGTDGGDNPRFVDFVYGWLKANRGDIAFEAYFHESDAYIHSDLFTGFNPKASAAYKAWMPKLDRT